MTEVTEHARKYSNKILKIEIHDGKLTQTKPQQGYDQNNHASVLVT